MVKWTVILWALLSHTLMIHEMPLAQLIHFYGEQMRVVSLCPPLMESCSLKCQHKSFWELYTAFRKSVRAVFVLFWEGYRFCFLCVVLLMPAVIFLIDIYIYAHHFFKNFILKDSFNFSDPFCPLCQEKSQIHWCDHFSSRMPLADVHNEIPVALLTRPDRGWQKYEGNDHHYWQFLLSLSG